MGQVTRLDLAQRDTRTQDGPVMLVVGSRSRIGSGKAGNLPRIPGFHFVGYAEVTAALLAATLPDVVLSPLFGEGFDAIDLARRLVALDYRGRYRVVADGLPEPGVVRAEVRAQAPGLDFDLFVIDSPP
jgi:hypothetical protein